MDLARAVAQLKIMDGIHAERLREGKWAKALFHDYAVVGTTGKERRGSKPNNDNPTHAFEISNLEMRFKRFFAELPAFYLRISKYLQVWESQNFNLR